MSTPLFVVVLILGIGVIQAAIWVPLIAVLRRRTRHRLDELQAELTQTGEAVVLAPESGSYRGSDAAGYPRVKGNAVLALTDSRIAVRPLVGEPFDVPRDTITGVRSDRWFLTAAKGGRTHLIVQVGGGEAGFFVGDLEAWRAVLAG